MFSAARFFGMHAVSLLFLGDDVLGGRSWLDPFEPEEVAAQQQANAALIEVAPELSAGDVGKLGPDVDRSSGRPNIRPFPTLAATG